MPNSTTGACYTTTHVDGAVDFCFQLIVMSPLLQWRATRQQQLSSGRRISLLCLRLRNVFAAGDVDLDLPQLFNRGGQMVREALEDLLTLLGGSPERVTDHTVR